MPEIEEVLKIIIFIMGAGNTNFAKEIDLDFSNLFRKFDLSVFRRILYNAIIKLLFPLLLSPLILALALALAF
jgi:hypothetical protein